MVLGSMFSKTVLLLLKHMTSHKKFIKIFNDILTSAHFAVILGLLSIALSLGIFVDRMLGVIATTVIFFLLITFAFLLYRVTERTLTGYQILRLDSTWEILDLDGKLVTSRRKMQIQLTKPLEVFHDFIEAEERLVHSRGDMVIAHVISEGSRQRIQMSLGALYPKGTIFEYEIFTDREVAAMRDGKYIELHAHCEIESIVAQLEFLNEEAKDYKLKPRLLHRKGGTLLPIIEIEGDETKNGNSSISFAITPHPHWIIKWNHRQPEVGTDYLVKWTWDIDR